MIRMIRSYSQDNKKDHTHTTSKNLNEISKCSDVRRTGKENGTGSENGTKKENETEKENGSKKENGTEGADMSASFNIIVNGNSVDRSVTLSTVLPHYEKQ